MTVRPKRGDPPHRLDQWLPGIPRADARPPKFPTAALSRAAGGGPEENWLDRAPGCEPAAGAAGEELAAGVWPEGAGRVGATEGTVAGAEGAAGVLAAAGAPTARFAWLPWLGSTVNATAAAAAARTRSVSAPAVTPVRKLTSSSRALMAARMPGHEPAVW